MLKLKYFSNGVWKDSSTQKWMDIFNPNTGEVQAQAPCCTEKEVNEAIDGAKRAYPSWSNTPVTKRVQVLYKVRELLIENLERLAAICATEHGKTLEESRGDILKAIEGTEVACSAPTLMQGESLMDTSSGYDTVLYRESIGVFAGIVPFNFPAMIPMGWMTPMCVATGNTIVLKLASMTPMTAMEIVKLYELAGMPKGVVSCVTCSRVEAELFMTNPHVKGISFVGSTSVGKHIFSQGAFNGKRVQALCEAKNHALIMNDAPLERTVAGVINSAFGCAGERCMALPVVVVEDAIADEFVAKLVVAAKNLKVGSSVDPDTTLGPVVTREHKASVVKWIETGVKEGAKILLDGRDHELYKSDKGFFIGATVFDHVEGEMSIGDNEIFGPVICVKRVKTFEEGVAIMNNNPFANGSVIYTGSGYYSREFAKRSDGGMVGINVGIPVPIGIFPFSGHKNSFFGDLHCLGKDGMRFFTESKCVTTHWFSEEEGRSSKVSTWDGTI